MKLFSFTVKDDFFPQTFNGEIEAIDKKAAELEIRELYAYELDTEMDVLKVKIKEVKR